MRKLLPLLFVLSLHAFPQSSEVESVSDVLMRAQIVDHNIQTAISIHQQEDRTFTVKKQLPEDKQNEPKVLVMKNGDPVFDWTQGQEARYLMEDIRQGLHALQSVDKARGLDTVALSGGREYWPKLRDISCHYSPGIRYYDLDGFERYCPI
jgi:hypothetical protein